MLWVANACGVFIVAGRRALGEASPLLSAANTVSVYAIIGSGLLLPVSLMLVATLSMASVSNNTHDEERTKDPAVKGPRQILPKMLQDAAVVGVLACFPFVLLLCAGALLKGMSHVKESGRERIGSMLMDVGILGANALLCFIILPITALMTSRTKY